MKTFLFLLLALPLAAETFQLKSPGEEIEVTIEIGEEATYAVDFDGEAIIRPSGLGFVLENGPALAGPWAVAGSRAAVIDEKWDPVWGQYSEIHNRANELRLELVETEASGRRLDIVFRAFDDGVGFRYEFPEQRGLGDFNITDELTTFTFAEDHQTWWVEALPDTYERDYNETLLTDCGQRGASTPVTMRTGRGTHVSLHEADLTDWAGMKLKRKEGADELSLEADLVPWFDSAIKVKARAPHVSPWRTIMIGNTAADLVESTLILNLNDPCAIEDTSWIQPAKFMGIWWGMITGVWNWEREENADKHGATTERAFRYIDACARNGIPCLLIEGWCEGWEGGIPGWGDMDFTRPYPDFDIRRVTEYAKTKGVALVGHHETGGNITNYENQLPKAFQYYNRYGISRIKTGYVSGDIPLYTDGLTEAGREHHHGQFNVRHHQKVVEMAAKYGIMIDAHEPIKATGISRTWPNFVAREGARGGEFNHFIGNPPSQTVIFPFTRLLGGPMDYTPALFDCAYDKEKRFGTRCQQLSLMVTLYSPLVMAADLYQAYDGEPAAQFIRNVPVGDWDETRVLAAEVGDYIVTARRKGDSWFLGATNNEEARYLPIKLDFLEEGVCYQMVHYADGVDADFRSNPYPVEIEQATVQRGDTLDLNLACGGGAVVEIYPEGREFTAPSGQAGELFEGRSYHIRAKHSGRILTGRGRSVEQFDEHPNRNQNWTLVRLREGVYQIANGHRVLSALASQNGSGVELRPVKERDLYQEWRLKHIVGSWFEIQNVESGLLLDVSDVNYSNGAKLNVWEKAWSPNQVWSLEVQPK